MALTTNRSTVGPDAEFDVHGVLADPPEMLDFEPDELLPGLTLHTIDERHPRRDEAERFVYDTYRATGFCEPSERGWVEETEPWRAGSLMHIVTESDGTIVGAVRSIIGRYDELPIGQFPPSAVVPDELLCEIGSLAVRPDQRGLGVANELHRAALHDGLYGGATGYCFLIDQWMVDFFTDIYAMPLRQVAPAHRYMGGDVVPCVVWASELADRVARTRPKFYKYCVGGLPPQLRADYDLPIILD